MSKIKNMLICFSYNQAINHLHRVKYLCCSSAFLCAWLESLWLFFKNLVLFELKSVVKGIKSKRLKNKQDYRLKWWIYNATHSITKWRKRGIPTLLQIKSVTLNRYHSRHSRFDRWRMPCPKWRMTYDRWWFTTWRLRWRKSWIPTVFFSARYIRKSLQNSKSKLVV